MGGSLADLGLGPFAEELRVYEGLLRRWQKTLNLVGPSTLEDIYVRHFADSAVLARFAPLSATWADLGSGAGFPGMIIAIMQKAHPESFMHLIESDRRKAAFLREVSRETAARVEIHVSRAEDVLDEIAPDIITSRAMASLPDLLKMCERRIGAGAKCVFLKGQNIAGELTASATYSNLIIETYRHPVSMNGMVVVAERANGLRP
jgi:16S rRNA (guanine527-N7)-methyltransferase